MFPEVPEKIVSKVTLVKQGICTYIESGLEKTVYKLILLNALIVFRINTLYMYRSDEDELPENFWLLNKNCFICPGKMT